MPPATPAAPTRWLIICAFLAIYLIWGASYLFIFYATQTIPPFLTMGSRFFAAGVVLFAIARYNGVPLPTRRQMFNIAWLSFFMFVINPGSIAYAQAVLGLPSSMAAVLLATVPLWMVLVNWLRGGAAPTRAVGVGLALGFVGILLLSAPETGVPALNPLAVGLVLLAAVSWAFGSVSARKADVPASAPMMTAMQLSVGGFGLLVVSAFSGELAAFDPAKVSAVSLAALAAMAVLNSLIGFSAFVWLMRKVNPAKVATYAYINPVVAVILGTQIAGEVLSGRALLGGTVILLAVFLITVKPYSVGVWLYEAIQRRRAVEAG